uniref:RRM domain-containing protein n=1 Tax=Ditylenchus dipsaci TaxID=166011 RepID=A0A915CSC0_9BILA
MKSLDDESTEEIPLKSLSGQEDFPAIAVKEPKLDVNLKVAADDLPRSKHEPTDSKAPAKIKTKREAIKYDEEIEVEPPKKQTKKEVKAEPIIKPSKKEAELEPSKKSAKDTKTSQRLLRLRNPSPPCSELTTLIHIRRLKRPFTVKQIQALLSEFGKLVEDGFWIDDIKTNCIAKFKTKEQAKLARDSLHGAVWPAMCGVPLDVQYSSNEKLTNRLRGVPDRLRPRLAVVETKIEPAVLKSSQPHRLAAHVKVSRDHSKDEDKPKEGHDKDERFKVKEDHSNDECKPKEGHDKDERIKVKEGHEKHERKPKVVSPSPEIKSDPSEAKSPGEKKKEDISKDLLSLYKKTVAKPTIYYLPLTGEEVAKRCESKLKSTNCSVDAKNGCSKDTDGKEKAHVKDCPPAEIEEDKKHTSREVHGKVNSEKQKKRRDSPDAPDARRG